MTLPQLLGLMEEVIMEDSMKREKIMAKGISGRISNPLFSIFDSAIMGQILDATQSQLPQ